MNRRFKSELPTNGQTDRQTDTDNYCNLRCACAPRVNKKTFDEGVSSMKIAKYKIGFTVNIFDDSDDILSIIQVSGKYVTQMHITQSELVQLVE